MSKSMPERPEETLSPILRDNYGRRLDYLRISLTDLCNLRCLYCMPPGGVPKLSHQEILSLEELSRIARVAVGLGVNKIRLTGGEPLLRKNLPVLLQNLWQLEPRPHLRLTTNGLFLADYLPDLIRFGFSSINISLNTLKPQRYGQLAGIAPERGRRDWLTVWGNVMAALTEARLTVKLNMVPLIGFNDDEAEDFACLTYDYPLEVRFIEYMPVGRQQLFMPERYLSTAGLQARLAGLGRLQPLERRPEDGPARYYALDGAKGRLGFISALSEHFCSSCNRLRLSAEGFLVPCLFAEKHINLRDELRRGISDAQLARLLIQAAGLKPEQHHLSPQAGNGLGHRMSHLGG